MADEAVNVEGPFSIQDWTVQDGTSISGGVLLSGGNLRTASANAGDAPAFAGVAATDKVANDGSTTLGLHQTGVFDMKAVATAGDEGAITIGDQVVMSGANLIAKAVAGNLLTGAVVGRALEDIAAGDTGEVDIGRRG